MKEYKVVILKLGFRNRTQNLEDLLNQYWNTSGDNIELILENSNSNIKERVKTINNLEIIIYSNDHNPPHFHVKSKDLKINEKFYRFSRYR